MVYIFIELVVHLTHIHTYEQKIGDIRGLPAPKTFPSIFPKHWWSRLTGERVRPYNVFSSLRENVNGCFSTGIFLSIQKDWESNQAFFGPRLSYAYFYQDVRVWISINTLGFTYFYL